MGNLCVGKVCSLSKNGLLCNIWQSSSAASSTPSQPTISHPVPVVLPSSPSPPAAKPPAQQQLTRAAPPAPVVISEPGRKPPQPHPTQKQPTNQPLQALPLSTQPQRRQPVLRRKTENLKDRYSLGRKLGHGQYGTTYLCVDKATGKEYACKLIAKQKPVEDMEFIRREVQIMRHLAGHPNIVSIRATYEDATEVHVVMELCAGGELFDRIVRRGHYTERQAAELARVIVSVVEWCHSLGVMHRDLKPENFLFASNEEDAPLKAIDFGLSVFFRPGEVFTDVVGSPYYVAPEVLKKNHGQEADVWSIGVIIYILLSGVPPFWAETRQGVFEEVLHGTLDFESEPWPKVSEGAKDLIRKVLVRDPKERLTARQVLRHPWLEMHSLVPEKTTRLATNACTRGRRCTMYGEWCIEST